jgi:hypothetical protein
VITPVVRYHPHMTIPSSLPVIVLILCASLLAGCGHGAAACAVVDAANQACTVIKYMGEDGKVREVRVNRDELDQFAREAAAREEARRTGAKGEEDSQ